MTAEGNNSANRSTELDRLEKKAAAGFSDAMFDLGLRYSLGNKGLTYDEDKAVDLIVRSAKSGYAPATKWISDNARSNVYIAVKCQDRIQTNGAVKDSNTRNDRDSRKPVKSGKTRGKNPQHAPTNPANAPNKPGNQSYSTVYEKALSLVKSKKTEEGKELMKYAASNGNNNARIWIKLEAEKGDSGLIGWIEGEADNGNQWAFNWISKRANLNDERSVNWIYKDADRSRTQSTSKSQSMKWVMSAAHYGNKRAFQWIASNAKGHDADCVKWFIHEAGSNNPSALNWILKNAGNDDTRFFNIIAEKADEGDRECILWLQRAAHCNREAFNWIMTKAIDGDSRSMRWLQTEAECNDVLFEWMCDKACEGYENTFNWMCNKANRGDVRAFTRLKAKADEGDVRSSIIIGKIYATGNKCAPQSPDLAERYFSKASTNDPEIIFYQGLFHVEDAPDESIRKISIAAESGDKKAIEWIRKNIGDRSRFDSIVLHYGLKPNDTVIFKSIEAQAMDGNPVAVSAIRSSAEAGHKESMYILGNLYLAGIGVPKSEEEAITCYEKASTADAHYQLAELLDKSDHPTEALEHYYNAASSGHKEARNRLEKYSQSVPEAAYLLARIYERKDYSKALEMMKKASLLGCEKADEWLEKENKDNKNNKINWNNIQYRSGTFRFYPLFGLRTRRIARIIIPV